MSTIRLKVISKPPPPLPCTIAELTSYHPSPPPRLKPITMILLITAPPLPPLGNNYTLLHSTYPEF